MATDIVLFVISVFNVFFW